MTGLPGGISFKKPSGYGTAQLKKIVEAKESIQFVLMPNAEGDSQETPCNDQPQSLEILFFFFQETGKGWVRQVFYGKCQPF